MVLLEKTNQAEVIWWELVWRISNSYRSLKYIIRPFKFPLRFCKDSVLHVVKARHKMSLDMESWYCKILVQPSSILNFALFGLN